MPVNNPSTAQAAPPGTVGQFAGTTPPAGWLVGDGSPKSRTVYAALFAVIGTTYGAGDGVTTFNLPDYRAEFLRGADQGRGVDVGRAVGTGQAGQMPAHTHDLPFVSISNSSGGGGLDDAAGGPTTYTTTAAGGTDNASENRPRNVAVLICVKT